MGRYLLKRGAGLVPLFLGITVVSFAVIHLAPGGPTATLGILDPRTSPESIERMRAQFGLNEPLGRQYLRWVEHLVRLDFGRSFAPDGRPVLDKILERLPVTVALNALALAWVLAVSLPLGILSALKRGSILDRAGTVFVFLGYSAPGFWLGLLLMMLLGARLHWLPISGLVSLGHETMSAPQRWVDLARHVVLPVLVLGLGDLAYFSRYIRSSMLEALGQEFVLAARAKGLSERAVVVGHALRNALLPLITILGLSLPALIGGSVIIESLFGIPGMGQLFYQSVLSRDYPLVMGNLVLGALLTLAGNLLADVGYALADPRIRVSP